MYAVRGCKRRILGILCSAAVAAAVGTASGQAHAQQQPAAGAKTVSPTGKGIAGGALLGAEVVMLTEGIIGIESVWPYPVFGVLGAAGGGVGGYFVEQADPAGMSAEASLYMLAGGMALVIPTIVVMLNATAYSFEEEEGVDKSGQQPPGAALPGGVPGGAPGAP
ncbi:MAG: hypothetical protein HY744_24930, partial [Deltaproteobacteria bacterium]|nr:hypothetical protein [Deltaproteobacteria bacterium]